MTTYRCDLDNDQQIYIQNQGSQTEIRLVADRQGQRQSQSNSFETGNWCVPPTVFRISNGLVLRIEAEQGERFIQVQANRMSQLDAAPSLSDAEVLSLRKTDEAESRDSMPEMKPMQPMKPMEPMKPMGPMRVDDMQMQMGNMKMQMGGSLPRQSVRNFCSQCGSKVGQGDRFCSYCGSGLNS